MWTLLLLTATVRSFAHMPLGISDHNKMVLWPGCEGHAEFSFHTKNVWSVRFVVKRRGCCCNLSGGVALDCVIHHERDVHEEQRHTYMWREQAIIEWSWHVNSIVACCHSAKLCAYATRDFRSQQYQPEKQYIRVPWNHISFLYMWSKQIWLFAPHLFIIIYQKYTFRFPQLWPLVA